MAYAAVASLSQTIDVLLHYHQHSISPQFRDQIVWLQKHAIFLQSFLEDAPDRASNWEETIREVTDRAEEILELLLSDSLLESTVGSSKSKLEKGKCELRYGFDELERVIEEIESIANRVKGGRRAEAMGGSDDELTEIIYRLRKGSHSLEKIAIFGTGGIGKTTLARNAYNDPLIVQHFDIRAWCTVTSEYVRRRMIEDILRSMKAERISKSEAEMIESLYKNLRGRRYLIVLDDVWSFGALDRLKITLPDNGNGSRIILTTRSLELARTVGHVHEMRLLDVNKAWNLFQQKIFKGDPCPSQLESVGKMIAGSCRGHPLSIEVVSGILAADQTETAWEDIAENIKTAAINSDYGDSIDQVLSLSYTYLPHHLRPCFLYLGIFREDHEIHVLKLIKLWVAEGFLNESECKSFEETGEECVEDLVRRSLVSVSKRKCNGRIKSIRMHDLMRDVCIRQGRKDNFNLHVERVYNRVGQQSLIKKIKSCRRVSTLIHSYDFLKGAYGSTVRTIILDLEYGRRGLRLSLGNVTLLRILDLSNVDNYDLSEEVFELFHLRYLAICCRFNIPEAISSLENLQTLIIYPSENGKIFDNLPEGIWRMPQLRHLLIFSFKFPSHKGDMFALENLQTLSRVVDFICSRKNLKMIPNLKKLSLFYTKSLRDYELCNLIYLQKLEILKIEMSWWFVGQSCGFPPTLKMLDLCGLQLPWKDMKIVASLPNLEVLKLRKYACFGTTWETSGGGFSQLTYLMIEGSNLEHWITEPSHFPRLKRLVLRSCLSLLEVPSDIGEIPTLELMELDEQNHFLWLSVESFQENRQSLGYDPLHVRAV